MRGRYSESEDTRSRTTPPCISQNLAQICGVSKMRIRSRKASHLVSAVHSQALENSAELISRIQYDPSVGDVDALVYAMRNSRRQFLSGPCSSHSTSKHSVTVSSASRTTDASELRMRSSSFSNLLLNAACDVPGASRDSSVSASAFSIACRLKYIACRSSTCEIMPVRRTLKLVFCRPVGCTISEPTPTCDASVRVVWWSPADSVMVFCRSLADASIVDSCVRIAARTSGMSAVAPEKLPMSSRRQ
mmetsp:Transcript_33606/g.106208  ORF Transcript_33606/g.106208 Transcript_33606/m.106208 type:complete len:247 (-) Transcript_33606:112-852(-)